MPVEITSRQAVLLAALLAAGFGTGHAIQRANRQPPEKPEPEMAPEIFSPRQRAAAAGSAGSPAVAATMLKSSDTLEELMALPEDGRYARLALWLADATTDDFEACWQALSLEPSPDTRVLDLLFVQWTGKDPHGAIRAAAGGNFSHIPWWGWAKNKPDEAFAHARDFAPDRIGAVLRSIGQSDPERAQRLLDAHPELARNTGLDGIVFGLTREDPEAAVKLSFEHRNYHDSRPIEAWLREDPHAAYEWFLANRGYDRHGQLTSAVINAIERENPEMLAELTAATPAGALRRKLEAAVFRRLALEEPAKALAQARETVSERIAVERFAQLALAQVQDDPWKARDILGELLERHPDPAAQGTRVSHPGGGGSSSGSSPELTQALRALGATDPEGTMAMVLASAPKDDQAAWNRTAQTVASQWLASDTDSFAEWAVHLPDPGVRDRAIGSLVSQLNSNKSFSEAIGYASDISGNDRSNQQYQTLRQWNRADPEAAAAWFYDTPLTEEDRTRLGRIFANP